MAGVQSFKVDTFQVQYEHDSARHTPGKFWDLAFPNSDIKYSKSIICGLLLQIFMNIKPFLILNCFHNFSLDHNLISIFLTKFRTFWRSLSLSLWVSLSLYFFGLELQTYSLIGLEFQTISLFCRQLTTLFLQLTRVRDSAKVLRRCSINN